MFLDVFDCLGYFGDIFGIILVCLRCFPDVEDILDAGDVLNVFGYRRFLNFEDVFGYC